MQGLHQLDMRQERSQKYDRAPARARTWVLQQDRCCCICICTSPLHCWGEHNHQVSDVLIVCMKNIWSQSVDTACSRTLHSL
jgi:hypothetical protein